MRRLTWLPVLGVLVLLHAGRAEAQADLQLSWWTVNPTTVAGYGSTITVNFGVWNNGSSDAGPFYVGFYYGDSTSTTGLTYITATYVNGLLSGETKFYTQSVTMPTSVQNGSRYLHYFIDATGAVTESDETNNRGYQAITITGRPDLQMTTLSVSPSSAAPGGTLTVTYRVRNAGLARAPGTFYLRFYYSDDATITTGDTYLNQEVAITDLGATLYYPAAVNGTVTVTVPTSASAGQRYIGAIVDYSGLVTESNEGNNTAAASFTVVQSADLYMATWSTNVSSVVGYGSSVQISFQVTNGGAGASSACVVYFYYGDTAATTGLTFLASYALSGIAAGASTGTLTQSVTMPANVAYGTRYLHYFIDATGAVAESNEANNRGSRTLSITGLPDLQVTTLSVSPTSAAPGATLTVTYRIYNAGYSRAVGTFYTRFYYSADATITTADTYLSQEVAVTDLAALAYSPASTNGTVTVTVPSAAAAGTRYIGAIADYSGVVAEGNEGNNTAAAAFTVTGANGTVCTSGTQCASTYCVDGVCCNSPCGGGVSDCQACSTTAGAPANGSCVFLTSSVVCRASAGACDLAETCTGLSVSCPTDTFASSTNVCRPVAGPCDLSENCTGSSAACPADTFRSSTNVCRPVAGVCDQSESCTGTSAACPADTFRSSTYTCRTAAGICDQAENCSGSSATCPADTFKTSATTCRGAVGVCDQAETCSGLSASCPADLYKTSSTVCRTAVGPCDEAETCSGTATTCPTDAWKSSTAICRAAAGPCDEAEKCSGTATTCPADVFKPNGTACPGGECLTGVCKLPYDAGPKDGPDAMKGPDLGQPDGLAPDSRGQDGRATDGKPGDGLPAGEGHAGEGGPGGEPVSPAESSGCSCELGARAGVGGAGGLLTLLGLGLLGLGLRCRRREGR